MSAKFISRFGALAMLAVAPMLFQGGLHAQVPQANTVPFVATNFTTPHPSWPGNPVTLKGTLTSTAWGTDTFTYDWDPGDGGTHCTGTVTNQFDIECAHTYTNSTLNVAVLNITDTTNGQVSPATNCPPAITQGTCYYTSTLFSPPPNLAIEVDNAIDSGLWYIHKTMNRTTSAYGAPIGNWFKCDGSPTDVCSAGDTGPSALYCTAFEVSGFLPTSASNPYTSDVALCLAGVFDQLTTAGAGTVFAYATGPGGAGLNVNADQNANGISVGALAPNSGDTNYQTGMMLDSIAAAGTPTLPVPTGTLLASQTTGLGSGTGGAYLYKDAVFDMVDNYAYCQNLGAPQTTGYFGVNPAVQGGGWHYSCQEQTGDNSVSQWAAIGIIPARRTLHAPIDANLLTTDQNWLDSSFTSNLASGTQFNGYFGYTSNSPIWGPFADTPSGMVQLAMSGLGRGTTSPAGNYLWDAAETYIRDNFGNDQSYGPGNSLKDYYYGMFSFTKSMLLHDNSGTGLTPSALGKLRSTDDPMSCASPGVPVTSPGTGSGPCYPDIDWYGAQTTAYGGTDPTDGVARTILGNQNADGSWFGQNYSGNQNYFQTAIAVIMLNKTVFQAVPVACFSGTPNPVASGGPVQLDGGCSVDQNPANSIVSYKWDVTGTGGTCFANRVPGAGCILPGNPACRNASCSQIKYNFALPNGASLPYNFPVRLRVTDNATPALTADVIGNVTISSPPTPPSANAGGPYNFCPNVTGHGVPIFKPFTLDGSKSTNPDQGLTDGTTGATPSTLVSYAWDYACAGSYTSASGAQIDASSTFDKAPLYGTTFNICLQVTNNDNLAFPTAALSAGLSSTSSAQVSIHQPTDEVCSHCVQTLGANIKAATPGVPGTIQLYWTDTNTSSQFVIDHYNVYRSTSSTFLPAVQIAGASSNPYIAGLPVSSPAGTTINFIDRNVVGGTTYYYRVAPAIANDTETCQGNLTYKAVLPVGRP